MFKIQVKNVNGVLENHYWINELTDDFIQFLPQNFGVPSANFLPPNGNIYKFLVDKRKEIDLVLKSNEKNFLKLDVDGLIEIERVSDPLLQAGIIKQADFDAMKALREADFSDITPIVVAVPTLEQLDFGKVDANGNPVLDANGNPVLEPGYTLLASHELCNTYRQTFKTYTGTALSGWPYDANGKFLGNN